MSQRSFRPDASTSAAPAYSRSQSGTSSGASSVYGAGDDQPPAFRDEDLTTFQASGPGLDSKASLDFMGRINVTLRTSKLLRDLPPDYARPVHEYAVDKSAQLRVPKLNIVVFIVGSRGDVQPYLAAALRMILDYGHRIRIATHDTFEEFVLEQAAVLIPRGLEKNLEFFPIGGDPKSLMAYMVKNPDLMPGFASLTNGDIRAKQRMIKEMLRGFYRSTYLPCPQNGEAFAADTIISNPPAFAHIHVAEALGIPLTMTFTMPWSATTSFSHPLVNLRQTNVHQRLSNYLSFAMAEILTWKGLGDTINRFRDKKLGIDPVSVVSGASVLDRLKVPYIYSWSSSLIPKPADYMEHIDVTGFLFLENSSYTPPEDLKNFLEKGPPPIYIGFGSIVVDDPVALTNTLLEAVALTGQRALISAGWSEMGGDNIPDSVFILGNVPHDWLFAKGRVSALVHHGGAGTAAIGLKNGLPTVVVPFFGDQPFWGHMIAERGAGPEPIPFKRLTADNLTAAVKYALSPEVVQNAQAIGRQIQHEDGAGAFTEAFHRHLPLLNMRCEINPDRVALWWCDKLALRLSGLAAETIMSRGLIKQSSLEPMRPSVYDTRRPTTDPLTGGTAAVWSIVTDFGDGLTKMYRKPVAGLAQMTFAMPKGIYNMLNGLTEGFEQLPSLYGVEQKREPTKVKGVASGFVAGGESFYHGIADGFSSLVMDPYKGAKEGGFVGFSKGFGVGLMNLHVQPMAGTLGLVAHPIKGIARATERAFRPELAEDVLVRPRQVQGQKDLASCSREEAAYTMRRFHELKATTTDRKAELKKAAQEWVAQSQAAAQAEEPVVQEGVQRS